MLLVHEMENHYIKPKWPLQESGKENILVMWTFACKIGAYEFKILNQELTKNIQRKFTRRYFC